MSVYMITYFISDTCGCGCGHDHHHHHEEASENKIIAKIKSLGSWANFMPEGYLIRCELSANEILKELQAVSNKGDLLFVTKVESDSCASSTPQVIEWIER